jgi:hypothetical protein
VNVVTTSIMEVERVGLPRTQTKLSEQFLLANGIKAENCGVTGESFLNNK